MKKMKLFRRQFVVVDISNSTGNYLEMHSRTLTIASFNVRLYLSKTASVIILSNFKEN